MAIKPEAIGVGVCYSNGEFGQKWTVWQVSEISVENNDAVEGNAEEIVHYRVLVGKHRRKYRSMTREDFANKVRYEVELVESTWHRVLVYDTSLNPSGDAP